MRTRAAGIAFLIVGIASLAFLLFRPAPTARATGWAVVFFDDFTTNTGWNVSECGDAPDPNNVDGCRWQGTVAFGHPDGGASVLLLVQNGGVTFPLVGREGLFSSLPSGVRWAFEIRFRFPQVTYYGVNIGMGSAAWTTARQYQDQPVRTDWGNALLVHQDTSGSPPALRIWVFGQKIVETPAPNTAWHTVRVEVAPDNTWVAYVDGSLRGSGAGAWRPNLVWFGNYFEQKDWGDWTDLHIDSLRIEYFVDDTPPVTVMALDPPSPNGENGWYRSAVHVTLTATDDASGVKEIRYRVDGGPWTVYGGPFPVSADGNHTVEAYAVDHAGNTESPPKSVSFRIDATPPSLSWSASPASPDGENGWYRSPITVSWSCSDNLSGVAVCPSSTLITAEGTNLTVSGTAKDRAGNTTTVPAGPFRRDATPPAVSGSIDPAPNASGWNRTPVTVTWTATDALSGAAACDPPTTVATEGANQTVSGACRDQAGNVGTGTATVNLDFTPPTITGSRDPSPNAYGWHRTPVTVTWSCADALSGIAFCSAPAVVSTEGANQSVTGVARDRADNEGTATVSGISIDWTPPAVTYALDPAPNAAGWHRTPVTITWSGSDALSGILDCDPPTMVTAEGADQVRTGSCRDQAGNVGSAEARVSIDLTPPQIAAARDPAPNAFGWVSVPVTVTFTCGDALSGIAFCPSPVVVATEGADQSVSGTARDRAGNEAAATLSRISIDFTPPAVQGIPDRPPDANGWYTAPFTLTWSGSDALSGVWRCDPAIRYEGPETALGSWSGSCWDRAENRGSAGWAFRYDATPPTITAEISPALPDGRNGWWIHPPVVSFACWDETAGIAFCSPPITVTTEGITTVVGIAVDGAGWTAWGFRTLPVDLTPPEAGLIMPASWCFACRGPVGIGTLMADGVSGVEGWALHLQAPGRSWVFTGTARTDRVVWDGVGVSPGETVTVTLVVTDRAGLSSTAWAPLSVLAPPPPPAAPTATPTPTPSPTPTRVRPTRTPTATPMPGETRVPLPTETPTPIPTPSPTPPPPPPPPAPPAMGIGVVFLDRDGDGVQDPDEPGLAGAVVEVAGVTIVTGPDGRFWMPAGLKAKLRALPIKGRLTVADGIRFGVQPLGSPWWLLGVAAGMVLLGFSWALDPRPKAVWESLRAFQQANGGFG